MSGFKFWNDIHYQYSCTKKFDFVPPTIPGVTPEPVFETATESRYFDVTSPDYYRGLLKVPKTTNHFAMEYNGKEIEVKGYLYSSNIVNLTGTGTKYLNEPSVLRTFTWKMVI